MVFWYGNGNRPGCAVQLYGHFVGVWISSNHQTGANKEEMDDLVCQYLHKPVATGVM